MDDYPIMLARVGLEGTFRFFLIIDKEGRAKSCELTHSTAVQMLDELTCELVTSRSKFDPALDDQGQRTEGRYSNTVRWVLPADNRFKLPQSATAPTPLSDPASWVSPNIWMDTKNYTLRRDETYITTTRMFRLKVDETGKVIGCEVVKTGRYFHPQAAMKDKLTCVGYADIGRFDSLVDLGGRLVIAPNSPLAYPSIPRIYYAHIPAKMLDL
jgi:hypothetical protein